MIKVRNKKAICRLSLRMLLEGKQKCLPGAFAILLTTMLFTALFTIGGSLLDAYRDAAMRQMGSKAMAGVKFVREEDYKRLSSDPSVRCARYRILLGRAADETLYKLSTEVSYATAEEADSMFCIPTEGRMPEGRLEIATSTLVLDALGVPARIGETVPMTIDMDGKKVQETFILSGYWKGDPVAAAQQSWVSKEYCEEMAPAPEHSFYETGGIRYAGYWMVDFDFANAWDLEGRTSALLIRNGYDISKVAASVNYAYGVVGIDVGTLGMVVGLLCLIMASGYLIIYNIFALNVVGDIQSYGLLKTVGTTGRQLKRLVRCQALLLSAVGIPGGLILGALLGKCLLPAVGKNFSEGMDIGVSLHPFLFLGASCFSFATVWISCRKPCRLAAKVSPVEAARYLDITRTGKQKRKRKLTAASFALANIRRSPKKVAVVVVSLSMSLVLLNSVYALIRGFDMGQYVSRSIVGDAMVSDASVFQPAVSEGDTAGVAEEMQKGLAQLLGVAESHRIYNSADPYLKFDAVGKERVLTAIQEETAYLEEGKDDAILQLFLSEGLLCCQLYGLDEWGLSQVMVEKGSIDLEKFKTGDYIILNTIGMGRGGDPLMGMYADVGDTVSIELPDGSVKEYKVMAIGDIPYAMTSRVSYYLQTLAVLPEQEFLAHTEETGALFQTLVAEKGQEEAMEQSLEQYIEEECPSLLYRSKKFYEKELQGYIQTYWVVGGSLSVLLAMIGILNFTNGMVTGILARKRELAMMEAVGMTRKQLKAMLAWEGGIYAALVALCSLAVSAGVNATLLSTDGIAWFYKSHFTVMPVAACIPVLLSLSCSIPLVVYRKAMKQTVVERLRG